jgi:ribosomal protein L11 methylase PrmA
MQPMSSLGEEQLFTRVIARVFGILSSEDGAKLTALFESNAEAEKVVSFLTEHIPNFAGMVSDEAQALAK